MYKFSIIIPNYNKEKYIRRCLNSIVTQSIKKQNYECINDRSLYDKKSTRFYDANIRILIFCRQIQR